MSKKAVNVTYIKHPTIDDYCMNNIFTDVEDVTVKEGFLHILYRLNGIDMIESINHEYVTKYSIFNSENDLRRSMGLSQEKQVMKYGDDIVPLWDGENEYLVEYAVKGTDGKVEEPMFIQNVVNVSYVSENTLDTIRFEYRIPDGRVLSTGIGLSKLEYWKVVELMNNK
jgi:hypothetical protein|nr:MAG TPA: hypothetical protein [Caudoviricetes sp.]